MHVALDTSALDPQFRAHAIRGTGRYVAELSSRLPALLGNDGELSSFRYNQVGRGGFLDHLVDYLPAGRTTVRHQLLYPLSLSGPKISEANLLHFPVHVDAPSWCRKPYVVTVLDLIPLIFKELYAPKKDDRRFQLARWLELQSIKNAQAVLAISENTAKDVCELLGVPEEKLVVTPLGVDPSFFERTPHNDLLRTRFSMSSEQPIILYVGGIDQRKNISFLLECFAEVVNEFRVDQKPLPCLVMVGEISKDDQYPRFLDDIARLGIAEQVVSTGYLDDAQLRMAYREADLFFYPSLYEGFGLPPLEAMASGTPVLWNLIFTRSCW
ncbi:MAG: glycosyltransferase family 4 protein [Bdellovibrionales bacterium]|nr:glycosyltransferase family 4 protein [Bdellovibrionales bacterium]